MAQIAPSGAPSPQPPAAQRSSRFGWDPDESVARINGFDLRSMAFHRFEAFMLLAKRIVAPCGGHQPSPFRAWTTADTPRQSSLEGPEGSSALIRCIGCGLLPKRPLREQPRCERDQQQCRNQAYTLSACSAGTLRVSSSNKISALQAVAETGGPSRAAGEARSGGIGEGPGAFPIEHRIPQRGGQPGLLHRRPVRRSRPRPDCPKARVRAPWV